MYDTLTTSYTFNCPIHGETHVRLSRFRRLEQLPGAQHPAVFRVEFECGCGEDHPGLVTHEDLDWAPLGLHDDTQYVNLMTSGSRRSVESSESWRRRGSKRGSGRGASSA